MGAMKRMAEAKNAKNGRAKAGSSGNGFLSRTLHQDGPSAEGSASWDSVPENLVAWLVCRLTQEGVQATFGKTRDGGALSLTLWDGAERHTEYFGNQADMGMAVWSFALKLFPDDGPEAP